MSFDNDKEENYQGSKLFKNYKHFVKRVWSAFLIKQFTGTQDSMKGGLQPVLGQIYTKRHQMRK